MTTPKTRTMSTEAPEQVVVNYEASPTFQEFHASDARVRGVRGPFGSGKSSGCVMECLRRMIAQEPGRDGVRRTRGAVVRNTYPQLRSTTIETWQKWFPPSISKLTYMSPIRGSVRFPLPDGTTVHCVVWFVALNQPRDVGKLKSLDLTWAWVNEASEIDYMFIKLLRSRLGRYPPEDEGGPTWHGMWMDTNSPSDQHWWYKLAEVKRPKGWQFWAQPPALLRSGTGWVGNPKAENIGHLHGGYEYYTGLIDGADDEWIKVYIEGEYGVVIEGRRVYHEFSSQTHATDKPLEVYWGLPLHIGVDFGLDCCAVIAQVSPRGQLRVLEEIVPPRQMGIRQFATEHLKPHLANVYGRIREVHVYADPAGMQRSQVNEVTCIDELRRAGIQAMPAPTNDFRPRREAVASFLLGTTDGQPTFVCSREKCPTLISGFLGGYHYPRYMSRGSMVDAERPEKNDYSHIADALGYLCCSLEQPRITGRARTKARSVVDVVSARILTR